MQHGATPSTGFRVAADEKPRELAEISQPQEEHPLVEFHYDDLFPPENDTGVVPEWQDTEYFGFDPDAPETQADKEIRLLIARSDRWPETRTVMKRKCWRVFGIKVCTDLPQIQRRFCDKRWHVVLSHKKIDSIEQECRDCAKLGAAAAAVILLKSGNVAAATTAFSQAFVACLKGKGVEFAASIRVAIAEQKRCTSWRRV